MIIEHALLHIREGQADAYRDAVRDALRIIESAPACHGADVRVQHEDPSVFLLTVRWESVEAHLAFRATPLFEQWRAATHPFYREPPEVTHFSDPLAR